MRPLRALALAVLAATSAACLGQSAAPLPSTLLRSWGNDAMGATLHAWEQAYRKQHPEITFADTLYGTATGMAGVITGVSDLSLMGRPVTPNEVIGFEWVHGVKPLGVQVMTGGLTGDGKTPSLAVFVSAGNPITSLSMAQLSTLLGCPADTRIAPTWSMAGASGAWAGKPVHAYLYDSSTGTGSFLQQAVLGTGDCWNWSMVHEFKDTRRPDGSAYPASQRTLDALRHDPAGLAVSTAAAAPAGLKRLALSSTGSAVEPSPDTLTAATYPLSRGVYIYIDRAKDKPVDPKVAEFLRFVLSPEGQAIVRERGDYLPLSPAIAAEQLKKLQ